ncbi:hypothetical protein RintRC_3649 [Richelia intracellularis]|nr:hypothetical protein RintRC_3649 [Richelia intracellularis]
MKNRIVRDGMYEFMKLREWGKIYDYPGIQQRKPRANPGTTH